MKNVGFSVPPPMADEIEQMAKKEHRTKSEFFRRVFTLYRTHRERIEQAEEEQFERMVDGVIAEALKAQEEGRVLMNEQEVEKVDEELMRYGAQQGRRSGIDVDDDEEINRIIHNVRARRREKHRT